MILVKWLTLFEDGMHDRLIILAPGSWQRAASIIHSGAVLTYVIVCRVRPLGAGVSAKRCRAKPVCPAARAGRALALAAAICELVNNRPAGCEVAAARRR